MSEVPINPNVRQAVAELSDVLQPGLDADALAAQVSRGMPAADLATARGYLADLRRADEQGGLFRQLPPVAPGSFEEQALQHRARLEAQQSFGLGQKPVESEDAMRRRFAAEREAKGQPRHPEPPKPPKPPPTHGEVFAAVAERMRQHDAGSFGLRPKAS